MVEETDRNESSKEFKVRKAEMIAKNNKHKAENFSQKKWTRDEKVTY